MNELDTTHEAILIECLHAIEGGETLEDCLSRYPGHAEALRPYLVLRARMLSVEAPEPPEASYESGRQALLSRLVKPRPPARERILARAARSWRPMETPLVRLAAASFVILLLAGGALGASAARGFDPAQDVLSTLHIIDLQGPGDGEPSENAEAGADNASDGIGNAPTAVPGREHANDRALEGGSAESTGAPEEIPGVGLCFVEGELGNLENLPERALEHVPGAGSCIPEGLLQHAPDGRPCVPERALEHLPDQIQRLLDDESTCDDVAFETPAGPPFQLPTQAQPTVPTPAGPPSGRGPQ